MPQDTHSKDAAEPSGAMPPGEAGAAAPASGLAPGEEEPLETTPDAEAAMPSAIEAPLESARGLAAAFRALRHRNFRLFFGGQLTSLIGTWMQTVAQSWLVLKLTNSALMLGVVSFATYLPILIVTLFAGVIIDHVDRRRLIIVAQALLMLSAFVLAALTWAGWVRVEYVIILAAFNGVVSSFDLPGRQAFVVEMVGIEDLPNAIALNSMIFNGARTIGPAVAGLLIAITSMGMCFFLNGASYLAVIWSLFAMRLPAHQRKAAGPDMWHQLRAGMAYVWSHEPTFYLLLMVSINSGFGLQYGVLIPVFARDILHGGASAYGFLMAAQGAGAVLGGALMAARSSDASKLRQNLFWGLTVSGAAIVIFGLSRVLWLSIIAQMIIGAGLLNFMATTNTMLQLFVTDDLRGRVMSFYTLSFIGLAPLGALLVGYIGDYGSAQAAVVLCGVIALGCSALMLTRLKLLAEAQAQLAA
jgi:MFS family permease